MKWNTTQVRWNTTHILNYVCVLCPATLSDQPTEAVPVWEQLISSRCATPMSARISTVTRERSNAMLGTLTLSYIATSTTGCLMNTQTVSVHPQMEREWSSLVERWAQKEAVIPNIPAWGWKTQVMIHSRNFKNEWKPKRGSKHIIVECGWVLYIGNWHLAILLSKALS